jgi:hypothetical protein
MAEQWTMHCVKSLSGKSSSKLSTTILRKLSKYKTCEIRSAKPHWSDYNVPGCDSILSGRFTANILKQPEAPPHLSPQSNIHLHGRWRKQHVLHKYQHLSTRQHSTMSKKKILIFKYKLLQILKHKQLVLIRAIPLCYPT